MTELTQLAKWAGRIGMIVFCLVAAFYIPISEHAFAGASFAISLCDGLMSLLLLGMIVLILLSLRYNKASPHSRPIGIAMIITIISLMGLGAFKGSLSQPAPKAQQTQQR